MPDMLSTVAAREADHSPGQPEKVATVAGSSPTSRKKGYGHENTKKNKKVRLIYKFTSEHES